MIPNKSLRVYAAALAVLRLLGKKQNLIHCFRFGQITFTFHLLNLLEQWFPTGEECLTGEDFH